MPLSVKDYLSQFRNPQYSAVTGRNQPYDPESIVRGLSAKAKEEQMVNQAEGQWRANVLNQESLKDTARNQAGKASWIQGGGLALKAGDLANKYGVIGKVKDLFVPTQVPDTANEASYFPGPEQLPQYEPPAGNITEDVINWKYNPGAPTFLEEPTTEAAMSVVPEVGAETAAEVGSSAADLASGIGGSMGVSAAATGLGKAAEALSGSSELGKGVQAAANIGGGFLVGGPVGAAVGVAKTIYDLAEDWF